MNIEGRHFLQQALQSLKQGQWAQAEEAGRKAVQSMPTSADARHILAVALHQQKHTPEAIALIGEAVRLDPKNPSRHNDLGEILRESGNIAEAEAAYREAIRLDPDFAMSHNNLGICLHQQGRHEDARASYARAIAIDAGYEEAHLNLGSSWMDAAVYAEAEIPLRAVIRTNPRNLRALQLLALCCLRQSQAEDAIRFYRMAAMLAPDSVETKVGLAKACSATERHDEAVDILQQVLKLEPGKEEHYFHLAEVLKAAGRPAEALPQLQQALVLRPQSHEIANNLGNLLRTLGRMEEAEQILRQAIQWKPTYSPLHNNLGMICIETGRVGEAFDCFTEALRLKPESVEALGNLANTYRHLGDFDTAKSYYAKALAIRPDYPSARFSYAVAQLGSGDFKEGWENYRYRQGALKEVHERFMQQPLPENLKGIRLYIAYDQGIGDEIFFLRFAEELKRRGAWIIYRSYPKIASLLSRLPFIDMQVGAEEPKPDSYDQTIWVSDLAFAIGMENDTPPPESIRLRATPGARRTIAQRLAGIGDGPYLGLTWRAGTARDVATPWRALYKEVTLEMLATALRGYSGRILVLQRNPKPGEIELLEQLSGCRVHDCSDLNENLEQMLALLDELNEHVCVSNTNVHLRAALGKPSRVLIPNPPDWRWMASGKSPWFPDSPTYRQAKDGDWMAVLEQLRADLILADSTDDAANRAPSGQDAQARLRRIVWLTMDAPEYVSGELVSRLASTRYRALIPARELSRRGWNVRVMAFAEAELLGPDFSADTVVISKTIDPAALKVIRLAQKNGARLILDMCDSHFDNPEIGAYHKKLCEISNAVVASTPEMARVIKQESGRDAVVIGDPYEGKRGRPKCDPATPKVKLLWFGHISNLDALAQMIPELRELVSDEIVFQIEIVTQITPAVEEMFGMDSDLNGEGIELELTPWTMENNAKAIQRCDFVIIPTLKIQKILVKSTNRVVESLWGGRFVLAGDIPAYQAFKEWAWIDDDIKAGIAWALVHRSEIPDRISAAQNYISQYYSSEVISQQWGEVFET